MKMITDNIVIDSNTLVIYIHKYQSHSNTMLQCNHILNTHRTHLIRESQYKEQCDQKLDG